MAATILGTGFRPVRGNWEFVQLKTASAATFQQWAPLDFDAHRDLIEATSASSYIVGVAQSASVNSFPAGYITVAVPMDSTAVARASILSTVVASAISFGQAYGIAKLGNNLGVDVTSQASTLVYLRGNLDSATSTIDVQILGSSRGIPSAVSASVSF